MNEWFFFSINCLFSKSEDESVLFSENKLCDISIGFVTEA